MQQQEKWQNLINPILEGTPYELVGVVCAGGTRHATVRIYIDKPGGITIEEIAKLSRQISVVFDVHEPITGAYKLEVSSPGLDRQLFTPLHFQQQIGKLISLKTRMMQENRQNFKGILQDANETQVRLTLEDGVQVTFAYEDIDKAKVEYETSVASHDRGNKDE